MSILFFHCPVSYSKKSDTSLDYPPLGSLLLSAILEKENIKVDFFDNRDHFLTLKKSVSHVRKINPKILALPIFTSNIRGAYQLASALKKDKKTKNIIIALGGPHASADPQIIKRFPVFDICFTQEGEITFINTVKTLLRQLASPKNGKGGGYGGQRKIYKCETPFDLDKYPFPARHLVNWNRYPGFVNHNIMASRGCPFNCVFCSIPAIDRRTRYRNINKVIDEMKECLRYKNIKRFTFLDDTLTLNKKFITDLCHEIIKQKLNIYFEGHTRANLVDDKLLKLMKKAGCGNLIFGVESGSERIRNTVIGKGIMDRDVKNAIDLCHKNNIKADIYLMLGFPQESEKDMLETVNYPNKVKPDVFGLHLTIPLPGARIWEMALKNKIIPKDTIDDYIKGKLGEGFNESWPIYVPPDTTREKMETLQKQAYKQYYLTPQYIVRRFFLDIMSWTRLKYDIKVALDLLKIGHAKYQE